MYENEVPLHVLQAEIAMMREIMPNANFGGRGATDAQCLCPECVSKAGK